MKLFTSNNSRTAKILNLAVFGVTLVALSILLEVTDPIQMAVDSQLTLREGSLLYNLWIKPPLEVLIMAYIFNITNGEAFLSGVDKKLKFNEVGPYVYQEILENHNVTFNSNNTLSYRTKRTLRFIRERSVGDPKDDMLKTPNIPYLAVTALASKLSMFMAISARTLARTTNAKPFLDLSVHDYLMGYNDPLVGLASKFLPSTITFQKFGLLDRMYDEGDNVITINLPKQKGSNEEERENAPRDYSIDNVNGQKGLRVWDYDEKNNKLPCNTLAGSYDGMLFPRKITKGETFRIFRKTFCQTLPIVFSHPSIINGVEGYNFKLKDNAFESKLHDNETSCYCKGLKCLSKGLGNISPCLYNFPVAMSFPHFYNGDPSLLEPFEGLQPDEAKHGTEIVIQPQMGIPMKVHSRIQVNIVMDEMRFNSELEVFQKMTLPIAWVEIAVDKLTPFVVILLKVLFQILPYAQLVVIIALAIGGSIMFGTAFVLYFWMPLQSLNGVVDQNHLGAVDLAKIPNVANVCLLPLLKQPKVKSEYEVTVLSMEQEAFKKGSIS